MSSELLEQILHSKKVAYKNLFPMIKPYIDPKLTYQNVNIFVDVYDMLKQLYNPKTIESFSNLKNQDRTLITSELINIISHYRHFFASRFEKYTTFYFFLSTQESSFMKNIDENYKSDFYDKRLNKNHQLFGNINSIILWSFKLISNIIQYIPHAYFINTLDLEPTALPYFILSNYIEDEDLNIILSNDKMLYQDLLIKDNTLQIELRGEKSRIIVKENIFDYLLEKTKKEIEEYPNILPECINLIYPLVSHKNYNIPSVKNMGITRALSFINKAIDNNIFNQLVIYKDIDVIENKIKEAGLKIEEVSRYKNNFLLIDHYNIVNKNENSYNAIYEDSINERQDAQGLRIANERYFSRNPILLNYCFEGETYK